MMRRWLARRTCFGLMAGVAMLPGCSQTAGVHDAAPEPPPVVAAQQRVVETRRTHEPRRVATAAAGRKVVVGLLRLIPDREIAYGESGADGTTATDRETDVNVTVDVRVNDDRLGYEDRSSLRLERYWRQILRRELLDTGRFVVVDRDNLGEILHEIRFGESRYVNPQTSPPVGEIIAVQYLLEASIGRTADPTFKGSVDSLPRYDERSEQLARQILAADRGAAGGRAQELRRLRLQHAQRRALAGEYPYSVYLSLCDVRTGQITADTCGIGPTPLEALREAVLELADTCARIAPPARIAWVNGDRVFVDMGSEDGLVVGQRLRYVHEGPAIRNAAGQVIGYDTLEGGRLEVTQVEPMMAVARVIECAREPVIGDHVNKEE